MMAVKKVKQTGVNEKKVLNKKKGKKKAKGK
jgi:hypothetical protein